MGIKIGGFELNKGKTFIIAEISANHAGSFETAVKTVEAAKKAGADGVKLQTYTADTLTISCSRPEFIINNGSPWDGKTYYDLYKSAYTPWEWQPKLKKIAEDIGLELFSSPFDVTAADFLEKMDAPAYKIASFEITDTPLIKYVAKKGKPMLISTGIAEKNEISAAVAACREVGNHDIVLLKCVSSYPAPLEEANLLSIPMLARDFGVSVGLSDHTEGGIAPVTAAVLGASVIEKHFILDKSLPSPDASFSMTPEAFGEMTRFVRKAETAMGKPSYKLASSSEKGRAFARSLYAVRDIEKGEAASGDNVRSIRPAGGLSPEFAEKIMGMKALRKIFRGEPIGFHLFEKKREEVDKTPEIEKN